MRRKPLWVWRKRLFERGVYAIAIRPPTVPVGTARLRITPIADHTRADLDEAIDAIIQCGRELKLILGYSYPLLAML